MPGEIASCRTDFCSSFVFQYRFGMYVYTERAEKKRTEGATAQQEAERTTANEHAENRCD
jgi:hypothetical protein